MKGLVQFIVVICIVGLIGYIYVGGAAEGFARGGGEIEARLFSPSVEAVTGENGVSVAILGDRNSAVVAYSHSPVQPTPVPDEAASRNEGNLVRAVGAGAIGTILVVVVLFAAGLLLFRGGL